MRQIMIMAAVLAMLDAMQCNGDNAMMIMDNVMVRWQCNAMGNAIMPDGNDNAM